MVQTIFELAARPEYVLPLREEIRTCLEERGGYTKDALNAMHKLDSFIRESQRWNPLDAGKLSPWEDMDLAIDTIFQALWLGG